MSMLSVTVFLDNLGFRHSKNPWLGQRWNVVNLTNLRGSIMELPTIIVTIIIIIIIIIVAITVMEEKQKVVPLKALHLI